MGAAAVIQPRGPRFNNLTDIRTAPAGSPNQTAVTLWHLASQLTNTDREEENHLFFLKGCVGGVERGPGATE